MGRVVDLGEHPARYFGSRGGSDGLAGETLSQRIASLRGRLAGTLASEPFEDALTGAGWREAEERRHEVRGFVVREAELFRVVDGFPRMTLPMLRPGIGGLIDDLSLDAVRDWNAPRKLSRV